MKKRKRIFTRTICVLMAFSTLISMTSCFSDRWTVFDDPETIDISELTNKAEPGYDRIKHFSGGLELTLSEDESYYILSSGKKCSAEEVVIPGSYNGKPIAEIADSAFSGNTVLKRITIPESVIRIGTSVFSGCDNLEYNTYDNAKYLGSNNNPYAFLLSSTNEDIASIAFHPELLVIAAYAFYNHDNLISLTLPDSLIAVGAQAFNGCTNLKEVDLGSGVRYIGESSFANTTITELVIPDSVISIGECAFAFGPSITYLKLGRSVESIEHGAFSILNIDVLELPDSLRELGDGAFSGSTMKKLVIGNGLKRIEHWTFANCKELEEIEFGNSIEYIGNWSFIHCNSLREVKLPKSLKQIHPAAFEDCDNLKYNEYENAGYLGTEGNDYECLIRLPENYDGNLILHPDVRLLAHGTGDFDEYCIQRTTNITMEGKGKYLQVVDNCVIDPITKTLVLGANNSIIPNDGSVTAIGDCAFYQRSRLETLTLPEGITSIGDYAFYACNKLRKVEFNAELVSIGDYAFAYSDEYGSPELPEGLKKIGERAFTGCNKIGEIYIPGSVEEIGREAFAHCYSAYKITIGEGVTSLGNCLFDDCKVVTEIILPSTLKVIDAGAFRQCFSLEKIKLPDGLLYIEDYAFEYCPKLTTITLPKNLLGIGAEAFGGCGRICEFTFNSALLELGNDVICGISEKAIVSFEGTVEMWENIENHDNIIRGKDDMKVVCLDGEAVLTPDAAPPVSWFD